MGIVDGPHENNESQHGPQAQKAPKKLTAPPLIAIKYLTTQNANQPHLLSVTRTMSDTNRQISPITILSTVTNTSASPSAPSTLSVRAPEDPLPVPAIPKTEFSEDQLRWIARVGLNCKQIKEGQKFVNSDVTMLLQDSITSPNEELSCITNVTKYYPLFHQKMTTIIDLGTKQWSEAGVERLLAFFLNNKFPLPQSILARIALFAKPLTTTLAEQFIDVVLKSNNPQLAVTKHWVLLIKKYMPNSDPSTLIAAALQCAQIENLPCPSEEVMQIFCTAVPNKQTPLTRENFSTAVLGWKTWNRSTWLFDEISFIASFNFEDKQAIQIYDGLKKNVQKGKDNFQAAYVLLHVENPLSMQGLRAALKKGSALFDDFENLSSKPNQEKERIMHTIVQGFKNIAPSMLSNELVALFLYIKCLNNTATLNEMDEFLKLNPVPQQFEDLEDAVKANRVLNQRYTQLCSKSHRSDRSILKSAIRQVIIMKQMEQATDISLADISALTRRNLSTEEKQRLVTIIQNKPNGAIAKQLAAQLSKNKTLEESVQTVISAYVNDTEITEDSLQQLVGVKLSHEEATRVLLRIQEKSQTTQNKNLKDLFDLCTELTKKWSSFESTNASIEVVFPLALYIHRHIQRSRGVSGASNKILFAPETHLRRGIALVGSSVSILGRRRLSPKIGKGSSKLAFATLRVFSQNIGQASQELGVQRYHVTPQVRRISTNPTAIMEMEQDVGIATSFRGKRGFVMNHGVVYYGRTQAKIVTFDDRCDGPVKRIHLTETQQIDVVKDVLSGVQQMLSAEYHHGDLKPDNVLYTIDTTTQQAHGFLIDFNLSHKRSHIPTRYNHGFYGTPAYSAPELVTNTKESFAGDLKKVEAFALGTTFYMMTHPGIKIAPWAGAIEAYVQGKVTKESAIKTMYEELETYFKGQDVLVDKVQNGTSPLTKQEIVDYITSRLLLTDPKKRYSSEQALEMCQILIQSRIQSQAATWAVRVTPPQNRTTDVM